MQRARAALIAVLFVVAGASLVTSLEPWFQAWAGSRTGSANLLSVALGDSRRLFAKHFYVKADAYFHSGYYPSIFDQRPDEEELHMAANAAASHGDHKDLPDRGKPRDWIDRFSRNFYPSVHTHLGEGHRGQRDGCPHCKDGDHGEESDHNERERGEERELLPWLKLAATLDPERPETYVTAAFWLRTRLGKAHEAEQFLRQGLQANPAHPELLFELGRIYRDSHKDAAIARRIWDMALTEWHKKQRSLEEDSDRLIYLQLTIQLAKLAEEEKDFASAINYLKFLLNVSPSKQAISKRIADLQARLTNAAPAN